VEIVPVLKEGVRRATARNGLVLMGVLFVLYALNGLLGAGLTRWNAGVAPGEVMADPTLLVTSIVGGLVSIVLAVAALVVTVGAIRTFVSDETERLPRELFTRRMAWVVANLVVGGIVFAVVVGLGFAALIVPGLFLLVALAFWGVYVAVEDRNFLDAFRDSWALTRGHRLQLFGLGVAALIASAAVNAVFGLGVLAGGVIEILLVQAGSAITGVFTVAVLAAAYRDLNADADTDESLSVEERTPTPREPADAKTA
jgi:hypothetical protein